MTAAPATPTIEAQISAMDREVRLRCGTHPNWVNPTGATVAETKAVTATLRAVPALVAALEQAQDCILDETPEECTREEAREDTVQKIRAALAAVRTGGSQ